MENSSTTEADVTIEEMIAHSLPYTQILRNPVARVSSSNHAPFLAQQHIFAFEASRGRFWNDGDSIWLDETQFSALYWYCLLAVDKCAP